MDFRTNLSFDRNIPEISALGSSSSFYSTSRSYRSTDIMPSAQPTSSRREITPPEDNTLARALKRRETSLQGLHMRSLTPPEDSFVTHDIARPNFTKYQERFKEALSAYTARKAWSVNLPRERERVPMSYKEFSMLRDLTGPDSDQKYGLCIES